MTRLEACINLGFNNNEIRFKYNREGLLSAIMSPRGKLLMFSYESDRVGSVTDHTGRKLRYKYDEKEI